MFLMLCYIFSSIYELYAKTVSLIHLCSGETTQFNVIKEQRQALIKEIYTRYYYYLLFSNPLIMLLYHSYSSFTNVVLITKPHYFQPIAPPAKSAHCTLVLSYV